MNWYVAKKWLIYIVFIVSLFVMLLSIWNIVALEMKVSANVKQWEKKKFIWDAGEDELQIEPLLAPSTSAALPKKNERLSAAQGGAFASKVSDPSDPSRQLPLYEYEPAKGELIGTITIPILDRELPIIHGTDNQQLAEGVGHYIGSALPGEHNNFVIAGHRDTVFRGLGQVQVGDQVHIETIAGSFIYEIKDQQIVEPDDRSIIVYADKPIITIITCYPFDYVGSAPQRYILSGELLDF